MNSFVIIRGGECTQAFNDKPKALLALRQEVAEYGDEAGLYELVATAGQEITIKIVTLAPQGPIPRVTKYGMEDR